MPARRSKPFYCLATMAVLLLLAKLMLPATVSAAGPETECARSFEDVLHIAFDVDQTARVSVGVETFVRKRLSAKVRRNDTQWHILVKEIISRHNQGEALDFGNYVEFVFAQEQCIVLHGVGDSFQRKFGGASDVPAPTSSRQMSIIGSLDGKLPHEDLSALEYLGPASFVFGRLDDWSNLPDLLRGSTTIDNTDSSLAHCKCITNDTRIGTVTCWLDPMSGYLPRKLVIEAGLNHALGNGQRISALPEFELAKGSGIVSSLQAVHTVIDNIDIINFEELPVISHFIRRVVFKCKDNLERVTEEDVRCSDFKAPGTVPFAPYTNIPDYTEVDVKRAPQLAYMWHNGRIEPDLSSEVTQELERDSQFMPPLRSGWTSQRLVLVSVNGLFVLLLAAYFVKRHFASRGEG